MWGGVVINAKARIGNNCSIAGNVCIGRTDKGVPQIGNDVTLGFGSIIVGNITIADGCVVGAGAVVTKSCEIKNSVLLGVPAKTKSCIE